MFSKKQQPPPAPYPKVKYWYYSMEMDAELDDGSHLTWTLGPVNEDQSHPDYVLREARDQLSAGIVHCGVMYPIHRVLKITCKRGERREAYV